MKTLLILITILAEAISIYGQASGFWDYVGWFWFTHGLASLFYTLACFQFLPRIYRRSKVATSLFIFMTALSMPIVGMLGLTLLYVVLLYWSKAEETVVWRCADAIELPNKPRDFSSFVFGVAGLKEILSYHPNPARRMDAVKACRYISSLDALPLFRLAITDKEDDIRLLAFASIDRIENELNDKINVLKLSLEQKDEAETKVQLAELYWEIYYLGLAESSIAKNYLESARYYFESAVEEKPRGEIFFKLGRVSLALNDIKAAQVSFEKATDHGVAPYKTALYLAEISFMEKRYENINNYLCRTSSFTDGEYIDGLQEYWCGSIKQ